MENIALEDENGYVKDEKVYLKGYLEYPDREIGEVRRTGEEAVQYFKNRFNIAVAKVEQLFQQVEEAQNKGSYLTKLLQLRKTLTEFDGWGNFVPLLERLDGLEVELKQLITVNQSKNLEIKRALLEECKAVTESGDWQRGTELMQELKIKWLKTGPVEREFQEEIEGGFQLINDQFFQRRREYFTELNRQIDERIALYESMIRRTRELVYTQDLDAAFQEIRGIQNRWKEVGNVPPKRMKQLWRDFKYVTQSFFNRYNKAKGIVQQPRVNPFLEAAKKMTQEAETLPYQLEITKAADRAKELLNEWKKLTAKTRDVDNALSNRFRMACDKTFEMNYLMRVISYRYPDFLDKPRRDQLKIQIHQMDYLVKKEKGDLAQYADNSDSFNRNNEADRLLYQKVQTQKRKVMVKETILEELKNILNNLV
jgi:hypothetical protein